MRSIEVQSPSPASGSVDGSRTVVHLHNDDLTHSKFFNLAYDTASVPHGWKVVINEGVLGVELAANERRDFPVDVLPATPMPAGSSAAIKVFASSLRLLVNDKNPKDLHPEYKQLGGVEVEGRAVIHTRIKCEAIRRDGYVEFIGELELPEKSNPREPPAVFLEGVGPEHRFLPRQSTVARADAAGRFKGVIRKAEFRTAVCMFAGTDTLSSAFSGFVPTIRKQNVMLAGHPFTLERQESVPGNPSDIRVYVRMKEHGRFHDAALVLVGSD